MNEFMTNNEVVDYLGLDKDIITRIQTEQGTTFQATANEFLSALVNKIIYQRATYFNWSNPFAKYVGTPIRFGDTIENVFIEAPDGYTYDPDATDPFVKYIPNAKTLYATINKEMQYCCTINDALLRRAAINETGFQELINYILASMTAKSNIDDYFLQLGALQSDIYGVDSALYIDPTLTLKEQAELLTKDIIDYASAMQLPSTKYNKLEVMTATKKENLLLVIRRNLLNLINLDYLTGVFNLNKVDLLDKIIVVEDFRVKGKVAQGDPEVIGKDFAYVILDTEGFDNHIALEDGGMIYNPKGKYTNHFLNTWEIKSFKYFYNAVARTITNEEPTDDGDDTSDDNGGDTPAENSENQGN